MNVLNTLVVVSSGNSKRKGSQPSYQMFTCLVRVNFSVKASELRRTKRFFLKKIIAANPFCRVIAHNIDDGELSGRVSCFLSVTGHFSFNFLSYFCRRRLLIGFGNIFGDFSPSATSRTLAFAKKNQLFRWNRGRNRQRPNDPIGRLGGIESTDRLESNPACQPLK